MKTKKKEFHPLSQLHVKLVTLPAIGFPSSWSSWGVVKLITFSLAAAAYLLFRFGFSREPTAFVVLNPAHLYCAIFPFRRSHQYRVIWTHGNVPLGLFPDKPRRRRLFEVWQAFSCSDAELVIACGPHNYEEMKPISRLIYDLPNFIDYDSFSIGDERRDDATVAFVSRLSKDRGTFQLIDALQKVATRFNRPFRAVFVGSGDLRNVAESLKEKGLDGFVELMGEQHDVGRMLRQSAISICIQNPHLVGRGGGISVSSIEAMAAGAAIIAWDTPQYRQVVEHMRTGLLVPVGNVDALADAIVRLLTDKDLARRLGNEARKEAKAYDVKSVAQRFSSMVSVKWKGYGRGENAIAGGW